MAQVTVHCRRRKGAVARLRRLVYAVLLWFSPHAHAGAEQLLAGAPAAPSRAKLMIEAIPSNVPGVAAGYTVRFATQDDRISALLQPAAALLRRHTWHFNDRTLSLRGGVRLDLDLPESGRLHLDLFADEHDPERGQRWRLSSENTAVINNLWSVGGRVHMVKAERYTGPYETGTDKEVAVSPQLILDMDELAGLPGRAQLIFENSNWHDPMTDRDTPQRVWRLDLTWRF